MASIMLLTKVRTTALLAAAGVALLLSATSTAMAWTFKPFTCSISHCHGTSGDVFFIGTNLDQTFHGDAGTDNLYGSGGKDEIEGGPGPDNLVSGDGDDRIYANDGEKDNRIDCGPGHDYVKLDALDRDVETIDCEIRDYRTTTTSSWMP